MGDYPNDIWIYNRNGNLEAREVDIVVGNVQYTRSDLTTELADALEAYFEAEEIDDPDIRLQELAACRMQAKAALRKVGR